MQQGLFRGNPLVVIIDQHLGDQVDRLRSHQMFVGVINQRLQRRSLSLLEQDIHFRFQFHVVFIEVLIKLLRPEEVDDLHELVLVVFSEEKVLLLENQRSQHASHAPNVHREVVILVPNQELGAFVWSGTDSCMKGLFWKEVFRETPIYELDFQSLRIDYYIGRFHVPVHYASLVAILEALEDLVKDFLDVEEGLAGNSLNGLWGEILENERGDVGLLVQADIEELDDVRPVHEVLENGNFPVDFRLPNRL